MRFTECWFSLILGMFAFGLAACEFAASQETGTSEKKSPEAVAEGFVQQLEDFTTEEFSDDGLSVEIKVIPDLYLYRVAQAYHEGLRRGLNEVELEKEVTKIHGKEKKHRFKPLFRVAVAVDGRKKHFWLQKKLKSHIKITAGKKKSLGLTNVQGVPRHVSWKIYELNRKRDYSKKLAYFRKFSFDVSTKGSEKSLGKDLIEFEIVDLLRYNEVEKRSPYERIGINTSVNQLALALWSELEFPTVKLTFYPGKWKLPKTPEQLATILAKLKR